MDNAAPDISVDITRLERRIVDMHHQLQLRTRRITELQNSLLTARTELDRVAAERDTAIESIRVIQATRLFRYSTGIRAVYGRLRSRSTSVSK